MTPTDRPLIHIPYQHLIFVNEVIRHGDKEKAYGKAYPKARPQSCKPAACRLYNRPELKQLIDEGRATAAEKAYAKAVQQATGTMEDELLSALEKRRELARIVRRQQRMSRCYKFKDHIEIKEIPVDNPATILRAIELDTKLEEKYFPVKPAEEPETENPIQKQDDDLFPKHPEGPEIGQIYNGKTALFDDHPDLTDEQYKYLLKLSLTDERVTVVPPQLTWWEEKAGCWIDRDPGTGEYRVLCLEENFGMLKEGYEKAYPDAEPVTIINNDTPQTTDNKPIKQKKTIQVTCNGITIHKEIEIPAQDVKG